MNDHHDRNIAILVMIISISIVFCATYVLLQNNPLKDVKFDVYAIEYDSNSSNVQIELGCLKDMPENFRLNAVYIGNTTLSFTPIYLAQGDNLSIALHSATNLKIGDKTSFHLSVQDMREEFVGWVHLSGMLSEAKEPIEVKTNTPT